MVVSGPGFSCWSPKAQRQRKLGVCGDKTILSPPLPPWATPYLTAGLESRALLRHLRVKSRKQWQPKGAWFDAGEGVPSAPPPALADHRLKDLGQVCIHSRVYLYVEVMDLLCVCGVSNEGVFVCVCMLSVYVYAVYTCLLVVWLCVCMFKIWIRRTVCVPSQMCPVE